MTKGEKKLEELLTTLVSRAIRNNTGLVDEIKTLQSELSTKRGKARVFPEKNELEDQSNPNYTTFKKRVQSKLRQNKKGLTWGQLKTKCNFKQRVPYNGWVKSLESDIGLVRSNGVWRLR
jgi:hypothetical protein